MVVGRCWRAVGGGGQPFEGPGRSLAGHGEGGGVGARTRIEPGCLVRQKGGSRHQVGGLAFVFDGEPRELASNPMLLTSVIRRVALCAGSGELALGR